MFLNNYWKWRAAIDGNFVLNGSGGASVWGVSSGIKDTSGNIIPYIVVGSNYNAFRNWTSALVPLFGEVPVLLRSGLQALLAEGSHTPSPDDYTIGGTDITSQFGNLTVTWSTSSENDDVSYTIAITGTYTGTSTVVKRIGLTQAIYKIPYDHVSDFANISSSRMLFFSHELDNPITLNNGDPLNILLKIVQE